MSSANAYLQGNWGPVRTESSIDDLPIIGELPEGLSGMFVRNGPNPQFEPVGKYHWFDGDGMLHGVRIGNGRARYLNRYVRTRGWQLEHEAGKALWTGALETPQRDLPRQSSFIRFKKNAANTALVWHAGRLLAVWDTGEPYRISATDLQTLGPYDLGGTLDFPMASHPRIDPVTQQMMIFGGSVRPGAALSYGVVSPEGKLVHKAEVPVRFPMYTHDFAITAHYTILIDTPFAFDISAQAERGTPYRFRTDAGCRFGVIPRHGAATDVRWFEVPSCFVPHALNAHEEGDEICLVGVRVGTVSIGPEQMDGGAFYGGEPPVLWMWRFNMATGQVQHAQLDDAGIEFPFHNLERVGLPYRYGYAVRLAGRGYCADALVKYDLEGGGREIVEHGPQRFGGVMVFVPRPGALAEDDGWVMGYVHDERAQQSELAILDARRLSEGPVARILIPPPARVPYGVHAILLTEDQIERTVAD
ncbi:carotenoid cleavage dioxygenase [Panacagrimonas perspica]|uniref:Carotenoid cleavage dioxygenase n=1 Tax=Panacagrimonas perspica TaxID=381431 RepID=A0A4R7NWX5_9GAMM|nr:carotenoid oxygenase family protein [Panacagrimonas perspica]TDU25647.1 carotenoid cleavage dioxygenase [Panacagrimonas perspica]THD03762.1 hypothetical protein B1810_07720 [Panacagrimonas perspica]